MKRAVLAALAACSLAGAAQAGDVTIEFEGVQDRGGQLLAALSSKGEFLGRARFSDRVVSPRPGVVRVTFRDVPAGDYAVTAIHDADDDGRLKMDGYMPAEGWAFSGPPLMGPPDFELQKVSVPEGGATLRVPVVYPY
ncbi:MAG TPA: DUF2141 domain-containing protein [Caulobacteraceae bacterium]|nr:DUF2141 domain-containing protein [Caulobacteraceae bacterium]